MKRKIANKLCKIMYKSFVKKKLKKNKKSVDFEKKI